MTTTALIVMYVFAVALVLFFAVDEAAGAARSVPPTKPTWSVITADELGRPLSFWRPLGAEDLDDRDQRARPDGDDWLSRLDRRPWWGGR